VPIEIRTGNPARSEVSRVLLAGASFEPSAISCRRDYSVTESNGVRSYLEPRGLAALGPKMSKLERYAVTGSIAGSGIAPARLATIYVDDVERAAEALELVPMETGANVWLLEPYDSVVFERTKSLPFAPAPEKDAWRQSPRA
jgi:hypothetical protein